MAPASWEPGTEWCAMSEPDGRTEVELDKLGRVLGCLLLAGWGFAIGALATVTVGYAWLSGTFEPWQSVTTPQGYNIVGLLPSNTLSLVVEAEDGTRFSRHVTGNDLVTGRRLDTSWELVDDYTPRSELHAEWASCQPADASEWGGWRIRMPRGASDHLVCRLGTPQAGGVGALRVAARR